MRIHVHTGGRNIHLVLPTRMLFSKTVLSLTKFSVRFLPEETLEKIPVESMDAIFEEFCRIKKKYGSWELVDVESADGEKVKITL